MKPWSMAIQTLPSYCSFPPQVEIKVNLCANILSNFLSKSYSECAEFALKLTFISNWDARAHLALGDRGDRAEGVA